MIQKQNKEIKFWHWLKGKIGKEVDLQRIENTTGSGVPDVNACWKGREAWIELKVYHQGNIILRKEQYAWIMRRASHDGNVLVVVHNPETNDVEIYEPGFTVRPWGNKCMYVAITSEPDYIYRKTIDKLLFLKAIFGE
jgi:Holliday junction resolvase